MIDFCNGKLSYSGRKLVAGIEPELSVITNIELFASQNIPQIEYEMLSAFVSIAVVHPVTTELIDTTVKIRKDKRMKLPDALIAATALYHKLPLITRNIGDFKNIDGLIVYNPYDMD